jgi:hypothetical protein
VEIEKFNFSTAVYYRYGPEGVALDGVDRGNWSLKAVSSVWIAVDKL